ncbi:MAG: hypothetical protein D6798_14525 [Deltaproteobacteria bacterium]|nr:MAG: hypothetical protein D6798_14525 [Deltaproteobacteria bacterium]
MIGAWAALALVGCLGDGLPGDTGVAADGGSADGGSASSGTLVVSIEGPEERWAGEEVAVTAAILVDGAPVATPVEVSLTLDGAEVGRIDLASGEGATVVTLPDCVAAPLIAEAPGFAPATTDPLAVVPLVELVSVPSLASAAGPLADVELSLTTASGDPIDTALELALTDGGSVEAQLDAVATATVTEGRARFTDLSASGMGELSLSVQGRAGCPLDQPLATVLVGPARTVHPLFLPTARVGEDYGAALEIEPELAGSLPPGLSLSGGFVVGVPEQSGAWLIDAADRPDADAVRSLPIRLAVLPADDADLPAADFAPSEPGPYDTAATELTIPSVTTSRGLFEDVAVRVAFPADGGAVAPGRFPVIAFHHAAHSPSTIYDDYTDLHDHWASHGVIVASVDSHVNVDGQAQSWSNLSDMSDFQRASIDLLLAEDADPGSLLYGHVDGDRIFVSGHSRGGGASLISLWNDERVLGAICFEPVSPLQTPGQDWTVDTDNGDRPFPDKPVLIFSAARDLDEPWPLVDVSYEQTVGHAMLVSIHGANHEDTYDLGTPGGTTSTSTIPVSARHDIDQHFSTAFLYRFGGAGASAGDLSMESALFGPEGLETDLSDEGVSTHGRPHLASTLVVDAFQEDPAVNELGGDNIGTALLTDDNAEPYAEGLRAVHRYDERGTRIGRWARARLLQWADPDAELALFVDPAGGPVDLSEQRRLVLRLQRDCPPPTTGACPDQDVDLRVSLWDGDGAEVAVSIEEGMGARGIVGRHWSKTLLPLDLFAGVDLSRVEGIAISLAAADWDSGSLWVDDLRLE